MIDYFGSVFLSKRSGLGTWAFRFKRDIDSRMASISRKSRRRRMCYERIRTSTFVGDELLAAFSHEEREIGALGHLSCLSRGISDS